MTCLVSRELSRAGHLVTIVRSEDEVFLAREPHPFGLELIAWNERSAVESRLSGADAVVYQVGDNYSFHRGCMEWLQHCPGLVCLHDFYLGNLFNGWAQNRRPEAIEVLQQWYGEAVASNFLAASSHASFVEETCRSSPMTEWLCAMATGVITHSAWGIERVKTSCAGPIYVVPLAYDAFDSASDIGHKKEEEYDIHLLTVGNVNPNKRAASIIQAIATSDLLKNRISYHIVGSIQDEVLHELEGLAGGLGVKLRVSGEVNDAALEQAFGNADIVCCLRWPSLEAASASTIEALLHGKAVVVTDTGFYSELPDDCVLKIPPDDEISSLRATLEQLTLDANLRQSLGERGRDWSSKTFTAKIYAEQVVVASRAVARARPILDTIGYFRRLISMWGGSRAGVMESLPALQVFETASRK
ncbi:MAG: glycosyltransferase [Rhodanobacter sp.]